MKRLIQQGERAKPFFLKDNRDKEVRLSDFKGEEGPSFFFIHSLGPVFAPNR